MSFFPVSQVYAACEPGQSGLKLEECLTLQDQTPVSTVFRTPADLVNLIVPNLFVVAGVILFITIIYAGFQFIRSGSKGKDQAREILTTAIIGMIVMFSAYWIVQIIQIITGMNNLGVPGVPGSP